MNISRIGFALLTAVALSGISVGARADMTKAAVKKIANAEITKRAASLRGPVGPVGPAGVVGPAGASGQPGPMGPVGPAGGSPLVFDANGMFLGYFAGGGLGGFNLYSQDAGLLLMLDNTGDVAQVPTNYTTTDCTGTLYLGTTAHGLFADALLGTERVDEYRHVYADVGNTVIRTISASYHPGNGPEAGCQRPSNGGVFVTEDMSVVEAIPADLSAVPFTLPLALPLTVQ